MQAVSRSQGKPIQGLAVEGSSVGDVFCRRNLGWVDPDDELAGDSIAAPVLLGPVLAHVAATDTRTGGSELVGIVADLGRAVDRDEAEGRVVVFDAGMPSSNWFAEPDASPADLVGPFTS
jgi:hypothetical protein